MNRDQKRDPSSSGTKEKAQVAQESCILLKKGEKIELTAPVPKVEKREEDE